LTFFQQGLIFFLRDVAKFSQGLDFFHQNIFHFSRNNAFFQRKKEKLATKLAKANKESAIFKPAENRSELPKGRVGEK